MRSGTSCFMRVACSLLSVAYLRTPPPAEPTNDLDLSTVEVVEELVRGYKGVLLVVSHDRWAGHACSLVAVVQPRVRNQTGSSLAAGSCEQRTMVSSLPEQCGVPHLVHLPLPHGLWPFRAFMDNVADRLLVLRGDGKVALFEGTYTEVGGLGAWRSHVMQRTLKWRSCTGREAEAKHGTAGWPEPGGLSSCSWGLQPWGKHS